MAEWDSGYKLLFSHPELVADLLRGVSIKSILAWKISGNSVG